jgi:hypothetical protein
VANTITNVLGKLLADGVLALRQNAIGPRLVNRGYEDLAAQKMGNVVNVPIPSAIAARAVTPSTVMNSNVASAPTVALITLDHWMEAPFEVSDSDVAAMSPTFFPMQASEAIKSLANDADAYLWGKHTGFYAAVGAAGTTPFASGVTLASSARTKLNQMLAPMDDRFAVLDPAAEGNLLMASNILQFDQRGDQSGIINGTIGTKLGFAWYMDQNITTYTPGAAWVTGWVLSTVSGPAGSTTLNIINATASGAINVGDIFTVAGGTQQYVITTAVTAAATTQLVITFKPALATGVTVSSAITVIGTAYTVNLAANRYALAWASRPLRGSLADGHVFQAPVDDVSGIALRLEISRQYKLETLSYDYLAGANVVRPELGCKILG